jgi:hypothetical protein
MRFKVTGEMCDKLPSPNLRIIFDTSCDIRDVLDKEPEDITKEEYDKYCEFVNEYNGNDYCYVTDMVKLEYSNYLEYSGVNVKVDGIVKDYILEEVKRDEVE